MNGRLYRSVDDRMLAGVAGGLAEYWDADPSLIRILWVILAIATGGIAFVVYIIMAIVVPEEEHGQWAGYSAPLETTAPSAGAPTSTTERWTPPSGSSTGAWDTTTTGIAPEPVDAREARRRAREARRAARPDRRSGTGGAVIGVLFILVGAFFLAREFLPQIRWDWFWPLILIAIGVLILVGAFRRSERNGGGR